MKPFSLVSLLLLSLLLFKAQGRLYNKQSFKHGVGEAVTTSIGTSSEYDPGFGIDFPPLPPVSTLNDYDLPHFPPGSFSPPVPAVSTSSEYDPGFGIDFPPLPPASTISDYDPETGVFYPPVPPVSTSGEYDPGAGIDFPPLPPVGTSADAPN